MKKGKMKIFWKIILIIVIFLIGMFVGKVMGGTNKSIKEQTSGTTQTVEVTVGTQTIENTITSSGEVVASDTEKLELSTSKYFKTMCVEEDDIVSKGDNILKYSNGTYLKAEYDCLIKSYSVPETGDKCTSSNYVEVENIDNMQIEVQVDESEINKIEKGQEVKIELSALEDKNYDGKIVSINNAGTYSSSGTTFIAIVEFENDGNVKPGMSSSCTIVIEKQEDCIAIPIQAVQTNNNQKYVVVVNEDGTTENVNIETGISNDTYVQVTSGVNGGEKIQMVQITTNSNSRGGKSNMQGAGTFTGGQSERPNMPTDMQATSGDKMTQGGQSQ